MGMLYSLSILGKNLVAEAPMWKSQYLMIPGEEERPIAAGHKRH
jgi:hypothetical protein